LAKSLHMGKGFGARIFVLVGLVADKLEGMEEETTGGWCTFSTRRRAAHARDDARPDHEGAVEAAGLIGIVEAAR
jgi:hypothetical protein